MTSQSIRRILESALDAEVSVVAPKQSTTPAGAVVDHWFDLSVRGDVWHLAVEQKTSPGRAAKRIRANQNRVRAEWPTVVPVLAVPRLSMRQRQELRDHSVNHLDLGGHVWIRSPGLFIRTEGNRTAPKPGPRKVGRNPFSKKASLVARALLAHPSRHWRVREIAKESSLSLGYASEVLKSLVDRGYAEGGPAGYQLSNPVPLLLDWSAVYRWEDNKIHSFVAPFGSNELIDTAWRVLNATGLDCILTLLAGADLAASYVEHDQAHIYVNEFNYAAERAIRSQLHAEPVPRGGNLHILEPYYGRAVWYAPNDVDGIQSVSDVQLFLDLIHYPVRGPEAAADLLKKRLSRALQLSPQQIRSLREGLGL